MKPWGLRNLFQYLDLPRFIGRARLPGVLEEPFAAGYLVWRDRAYHHLGDSLIKSYFENSAFWLPRTFAASA
jgi:hypothetical protein